MKTNEKRKKIKIFIHSLAYQLSTISITSIPIYQLIASVRLNCVCNIGDNVNVFNHSKYI